MNTQTTRVFLAHPKDTEQDNLSLWRGLIEKWLLESGFEAEVVFGKEDFEQHFSSEGNFDAWARSVPTRRDTFTGRKAYDSIFVPGPVVGKATSAIVETAFKAKTPVFVLDVIPGESLIVHHATGIETVDEEDYRTGWRIVLD